SAQPASTRAARWAWRSSPAPSSSCSALVSSGNETRAVRRRVQSHPSVPSARRRDRAHSAWARLGSLHSDRRPAPQTAVWLHSAVVSRAGFQFNSLEKLPVLGISDTEKLAQLDAGQLEIYTFRLKSGRSLWALTIPPCEVSSQEVRKRLKSKQGIENLLPTAVESYILRYHSGAGGIPQ